MISSGMAIYKMAALRSKSVLTCERGSHRFSNREAFEKNSDVLDTFFRFFLLKPLFRLPLRA